MKHNKIWKWAAALAVFLALAGIWAVKNAEALRASGIKNGDSAESSEIVESAESSEIVESAESSENAENPESEINPESAETSESTESSESAEGAKTSESAKSSVSVKSTENSVSAETSKSARTESTASSQNMGNAAGTKTPADTKGSSDTKSSTDAENPDFALEAEAIDLSQLASYKLPIIIDFGADWCGPCLKFAPIFESVHDDMLGSAILKYVDIDQSGDVADKYPVKVIPTQVFYAADGAPYVPSGDIDVDFLTYNDKTTGKRLFTVHEGPLTEEELGAILQDMGV